MAWVWIGTAFDAGLHGSKAWSLNVDARVLPVGLDVALRLPASQPCDLLEPAQQTLRMKVQARRMGKRWLRHHAHIRMMHLMLIVKARWIILDFPGDAAVALGTASSMCIPS